MYLHGRAVAPNTARQQAKELKASPATMTSSQHDAISPATVWALLPLQALPSLGLPQRKSSRNLSTAQDLVFKAAAAFFKTKRSTRDVHPPHGHLLPSLQLPGALRCDQRAARCASSCRSPPPPPTPSLGTWPGSALTFPPARTVLN